MPHASPYLRSVVKRFQEARADLDNRLDAALNRVEPLPPEDRAALVKAATKESEAWRSLVLVAQDRAAELAGIAS